MKIEAKQRLQSKEIDQEKQVIRMTMEEWKKFPKDYKSVIDGKRWGLTNSKGATVLWPVEIIKG